MLGHLTGVGHLNLQFSVLNNCLFRTITLCISLWAREVVFSVIQDRLRLTARFVFSMSVLVFFFRFEFPTIPRFCGFLSVKQAIR